MRTVHFPFIQSWALRAFLFPALLSFMLLNVSGCSQPEPKKLPILRIGHAPHDHHAPLYIAAMNPDFFRENGGIHLKEISFRKEYILIRDDRQLARVLVDSSTGGKKLIRTLDERHNDITFGGVPAMLSFIDKGSEMEILLPVMAEGAGLIVHNALPVSSWEEFVNYAKEQTKPLKIGYKTAISNQNLIFETALNSVSIQFAKKGDGPENNAKVTLVNLFGAKNLIPALQNGIIDGFVVNQPFVAMAEHQGTGKMIASLSDLPPTGKWKNTPCCALAGNKQYVANHPEIVEAFMSLLLLANTFITNNPEQSAKQIAKWLGIAPEIELLSLPTIKYTIDYDEAWHQGVNFWVESMVKTDKLNNSVKTAHEQGTLNNKIYNMETFERAQRNN